jgi:hypothetical protein
MGAIVDVEHAVREARAQAADAGLARTTADDHEVLGDVEVAGERLVLACTRCDQGEYAVDPESDEVRAGPPVGLLWLAEAWLTLAGLAAQPVPDRPHRGRTLRLA